MIVPLSSRAAIVSEANWTQTLTTPAARYKARSLPLLVEEGKRAFPSSTRRGGCAEGADGVVRNATTFAV